MFCKLFVSKLSKNILKISSWILKRQKIQDILMIDKVSYSQQFILFLILELTYHKQSQFLLKVNKITIIIQIMPIQSQIHSNLIISALNHLQLAINKLPNAAKTQTIHQHLNSCSQDLKQYLQTCDSYNQTIAGMEGQIDRLRFQKEYIIGKHNEILQNLQMLVFQKDYDELQLKIDHYKSKPLQQSILTFVTHPLNDNSLTNTLNRSFVIQNTSSSRNQFLSSSRLQQLKMDQEHHEKQKIKTALKIVNSQRQTFENKQDVWLGIVYSKNAKEESRIFKSGQFQTQRSQDELQFSQITITQTYEPKISKFDQKIAFSGKKVKSMIHLKEKSSKKKSLPKTSVKKEVQGKRLEENVEFQDEKIMKKKLNFVKPSIQKSSRKKVLKPMQVKNSKSIKKQLTVVG